MKKILLIALTVILIICITACGDKTEDVETEDVESPSSASELEEDVPEIDTTQDALSGQEEQDGITSINTWPINRYTERVPEPESGTLVSMLDEGSFLIITMDWTAEDAKAYFELIKASGYDKDILEIDLGIPGTEMFTATNADNIRVDITIMGGITISFLDEAPKE